MDYLHNGDSLHISCCSDEGNLQLDHELPFTLFWLTEGSVNVVSIECIYPKCPNQVGELGQLARSLKGQNIEPSLLMGI